ncbi:BON domain-containing protein [Ferribacterium limneticum]|uniref:BON domain-containing protein n=1 Tax=Ferribacterium limneticum TaxID=76259 RepID=UPI001CF90536|nr:BON domain-containing protein [Ferribacterium limneticum]
MQKAKLTLAAAALITLLPMLQGCVPVIVGGAAAGVMSAHDRRSTGTQADDETTEWKAGNHVPDQYKTFSHINFTSYNRRVLITGEVPNEEAKAAIEAETRKLDGVREVYNELGIGPASSLGSRSTDSYIDSKVKARLVDSNQISANHIKVVTERAIVHLMGIVNAREAKVAVDVARTTSGVKKVVNVLEVVGDEDTRRLDDQTLGARTPPPASAPVESR